MRLLFISDSDDAAAWTRELTARLPDLEVRVWPEAGEVQDIDAALVWKPPPGALARFPNLRLVQSLAMGMDHLLADPELPRGVPLARIVDPDMIGQMSEYVLLAVLRHHRRADEYDGFQREGRWTPLPPPDTVARRVGVMGMGEIGGDAARKLAGLGFPVAGWSRTEKSIRGIESFHGAEGLAPFLARSDVLVCLLPLTPETEGVIGARALAALPRGAYVVNCARGAHLVEADLLAALDSGHIAGAALDVFEAEPLPPGHAFWTHPKVRVTPHIAGLTNPRTAAEQVAENLRRVRDGRPILHRVDPARGY